MYATGSRFIGPHQILGNGDLHDQGGNAWE
jgi:hypothetical protein